MGLSRAERSFIQCMMGSGALPARRTTALFNACVENAGLPPSDQLPDSDAAALSTALTRINRALSPFELAFAAAPHANDVYWGLTNVGRDASVKQATNFSPSELALFFAIRDRLIAEGDGKMPLVDAHNEGPSVKLRVADAARTVAKLVALQWLTATRRAGGRQIEFGARAMLEMPDVRAWARARAGGGGEVKDEASREMEAGGSQSQRDGEEGTQRRGGRGRRKSRPDRNGRVDADDDGEEEEEEEVARPRRGRSQRKSQAAPSRTQEADAEDEEEDEEEEEEQVTQRRKRARNGSQSRRRSQADDDEGATTRRRSRAMAKEEEEETVTPRRSMRTRGLDSPLSAPRPRGRRQ